MRASKHQRLDQPVQLRRLAGFYFYKAHLELHRRQQGADIVVQVLGNAKPLLLLALEGHLGKLLPVAGFEAQEVHLITEVLLLIAYHEQDQRNCDQQCAEGAHDDDVGELRI